MVRDILCLVVTCDSERTTEDNANIEEPTKYLSDIAFQTRLSLPQQLTPRDAAMSSMSRIAAELHGRRNVLEKSEPKSQNVRATVTKSRTREKEDNSDSWQHEDVLDSSVSHTAPVPGGVASGQTHQNVHNLVSLLPSSSTRC